MELSLHPASLGNVNILLTSGKDGIVAKFTAQNQIVKEAVEAQMVQLQQKFDEQGIKVTSIEVTIASHSFEQNLEQGNDRRNGEPAEARKVKPLRRINLSEIGDDVIDELTSDADRIAASMMAVNGNSVDFSA
jgi:flagellar hook-length control protein FliK